MKVKAALGVKVPMENQPNVFIEQVAVEVEDSLYYRRRIADGDLVIVAENRSRKEGKND